ncbi:MAG: hypothetical protein ACOC4F_00780 [bacterium]
MRQRRGRTVLLSLLTAAAILAFLLGPGRPVLQAAASTLYSALLYARYLFLAVPGVFWWTITSIGVVAVVARTSLRELREGSPYHLWRRTRRRETSPDNRLRTLRNQLLEMADSPTSRAVIERELVDLTSHLLRGRRWTRTGGAELATHPALSGYPELRNLVETGPEYTGPRRIGKRDDYRQRLLDETGRHIRALETITSPREYHQHE